LKLNIKAFNIFIFIAGIVSFTLFLTTEHLLFIILFFTFFLYYFMVLSKLLIDFKSIMSDSGNIRDFSTSTKKNFFKELNELIIFIKETFYKDQLVEAVNLTLSKNSSSESFFKIVIENLGLIFKTPHIAFILYDPTIEKFTTVASNGVFLNISSSENYSELSKIQNKIIQKYEYMHIFKTDISLLRNLGIIKLESHLDYMGYVVFGYQNLELTEDFFKNYSTIILEVQSAFNLHINDKKLREKIYDLNLLNKTITLMEENRDVDELLHLFLTHLTAREGLGFNRAVFYEQDINSPNVLIGKKSIGPLSYIEADEKWNSLKSCPIDLFLKSNPEKIAEPLESIVINSKFFLNEDPVFNEIMSSKKFRILDIDTPSIGRRTYQTLKIMNFKEFIAIPIVSYENTIGLIIVDNLFDSKAFSDSRVNSLINFSAQTALVINNLLLYNQVKILSIKDSLTTLYNRRFFEEQLTIDIDRSIRTGLPISLMMIDIDFFKNYNDKNGHIEGDTLLSMISKLFKQNCRSSDFVCRYGGEEFAIILPDTGLKNAVEVAEKIRKKVYETFFPNEENQPLGKVTISIGVASFPDNVKDREELKVCSDKALYLSKENGRNCVSAYKKDN
jgi:diguanylate cyclase (GGDEF)-like protein